MSADEFKNNPFDFKGDKDTIFLFNGILFFLIDYFGHSKEEAVSAINHYYKWRAEGEKDDEWIEWLGHDHVYIAASRIEHAEFLPQEVHYDIWFDKVYKSKSPLETFRKYKRLIGLV